MMQRTILSEQQAVDYCNAVLDSNDPYDCEYGHAGCAASPRGPCLDETMGTWSLTDDMLDERRS